MAEVKNSFLSSKMNKDLDDRLIPNSEYRDALNIEVGKSETNNIGVLQNVYGNIKITSETNPDLECIGTFMDNENNRIFQFLTDYTDPFPNNITYPTSGTMKIVVYNFNDPAEYITLVEGLFLNFAKNRPFRITGVNLIEGLLFWTDNRNQPRKININLANPNSLPNPTYYTTEEQISVAKYAPVDPITMYRKVTATVTNASASPVLTLNSTAGIVPGMTVISENITGADYMIVTNVSGATITLYDNPPTAIVNGDELTFLISTMSDKSDIPEWPGDPVFLEDRYVRFSYRFKYDDNEYSLMAPFTQIAYIPKQKGYFIAGNETDAYRSTVINWFENNVNNIELIVPLPDKVGELTNSYKIEEIDILYKESESLVVSVFETIPISAINTTLNANNNYYVQPYQSQKPYKTLPEAQTVRVYDKVPVRAKAQEVGGNRVIYGNYYDKYTCVSSINYNMSVQTKSPVGTNFIEYPNHTLKKNRNYQVGFILADKFGRQSPVILSTVDVTSTDIGGGNFAKGSTVYSGYEDTLLFQDVRSWFGDALILYLNAPIEQSRSIPSGTPGLYAIATSSSGFAITAATITNTTYKYTLDTTATLNTPPANGNIMRGFYTDYVKVLSNPVPTTNPNEYTITTSGRVGDIYKYVPQPGGVKDIKFAYEYNPIGWYSYKIVVKQQEQDYYNVYLPGMLNGYPKNQTSGSQVVYSGSGTTATSTLENGINTTQFPVSETGNTSHIVLINDNINKVPLDLSIVGPDQKQYRSNVQLYGRVENTEANIEIIGIPPSYSAKVRTIEYSTTTVGQGNYSLIKPGDGIQCVEANKPVPDTTPPAGAGATMPNPYRWFGDTVVVSNVIVGTTGTITLSSPCWVLDSSTPPNNDDYVTFIITRAENKQYFPTRKADTVIAIADASEFNFLSSSQDNLSGTAGLNFYQLQNNPRIGRVSNVNKIGVIASDMIPFLSVYETKPTQSLLELFWETTTTGLISDLNADVLTGFEGPSSFGELEYDQFENQDPNGTDLGPLNWGQADSKYITSEFYVLDQNGFPLANTTVTLLSVTDGNSSPRLADFGIETIVGSVNKFRLYITTSFVFNNNAGSAENYSFVFNVVDLDKPSTATQLTITGRLGNNPPIITTTETNYNITQDATNIVTLDANNGSFSLAETGLKWTIASGDTTSSFSIDPYTGELSLTNPNVPLGVYSLVIKVQDAVNSSTGAILPPENTVFGTQSDTITLIINVGDDPVPFWLRPNYASTPANGPSNCGGGPVVSPCGMVYIGPNISPSGSYVPSIPGLVGSYQFIQNIEVQNAAASGISPIIPTGLNQGEYRFQVELLVASPQMCSGSTFSTIRATAEIYLYKRIYNAITPNPWILSANENNYGITPPVYTIGPLVVTTIDSGSGPVYEPTKVLTTSFSIEADPDPTILYEFAVGVKLVPVLTNVAPTTYRVKVYGNDANYSYNQTLPFTPPRVPITNDYAYYTGVEEYSIILPGETSAIPYDTQDATRGVSYYSGTNGVSSGTIATGDSSVELILSTFNQQVVPGLYYTFTLLAVGTFTGRVAGINVDSNPNKIALQLDSPFSGTPGSLAGGNIAFETASSNLTTGILYANTEEGTEVKRLYKDAAFTQKWIPPVANKFYNFVTSKNYNPGGVIFGTSGPLKYTEYPYYSAFFNADGEVVDQTAPIPNVETAWDGQNTANTAPLGIDNYSYNVLYIETP